MPADSSPADPPWTVRAAAALALAEAVGAGVFAVLFLLDVLPLEDPVLTHAGYAFGILAIVVGAAAVLVVAAQALVRCRPWARSLLVVAQVMALAIGFPMVQGGDWVGWPVVAMAATGFGLLLHPRTTAALELADRSG